jgi:hypothetical protein
VAGSKNPLPLGMGSVKMIQKNEEKRIGMDGEKLFG